MLLPQVTEVAGAQVTVHVARGTDVAGVAEGRTVQAVSVVASWVAGARKVVNLVGVAVAVVVATVLVAVMVTRRSMSTECCRPPPLRSWHP